MRSQHCGYWCPGAKAPGNHYPQCWLNIHCIGLVSYKKYCTYWAEQHKKMKSHFENRWPGHLRVKCNMGTLMNDKKTSTSVKHFYTPRTTKLLGGILVSLRPSVRPSVPHAVSALYHLQLWMDSFHIRHKWSLPWEGVSCTMTFDLDLYLQGHLALT